MISTAEVQQIIAACNKAGVPSLAGRAIADGVSMAGLEELFSEAKQIRDVCKLALNPEHANAAILAGQTLVQVKAALFDQITAEGSEFRKSETVASKAAFLTQLVDQDAATPTQGAISPDAGYDPKKDGAKGATGPKPENQQLWSEVWKRSA
jgi:hypothetical protein